MNEQISIVLNFRYIKKKQVEREFAMSADQGLGNSQETY